MGLGSLFGKYREKKEARAAWNGGQPNFPELDRGLIRAYAPHWALWAGQVEMSYELQYSPKAEMMSQVEDTAFWREMFRTHGFNHEGKNWNALADFRHVNERKAESQYWHRLVGEAAIYGNMSAMHAYSEVFGRDILMQELTNMSVIHPRILSWCTQQDGVNARQHLLDLVTMSWDRKEYLPRPERTMAKPGDGEGWIFQWIQDWLKLPPDLLDQNAGLEMCLHLYGYLNDMAIPVEDRPDKCRAPVDDFYLPQKCLLWGWGAGLNAATPVPLYVSEIEVLLQQLCAHFELDTVLLDTLAGRWAPNDLTDPKVFSVVRYMNEMNMHKGTSWTMLWKGSWDADQHKGQVYEAGLRQLEMKVQEDAVLGQELRWQSGVVNTASIYRTALKFVRPSMEAPLWSADVDVGPLFV